MEYTNLSQRSSSDLSKDTLLEKEDFELHPQPRKTWRQWLPVMVLHGILITIYTVICFSILQKSKSDIASFQSKLVDTPARPAMVDELTHFDYRQSTTAKWFGEPSEELDQKWNDILDHGTFRFSKDEMIRYGRGDEGVELQDGSGYMGTLNVFHEMHCLKRVYMYVHKDKYYGKMNLTEYEQLFNLHHTMHCLDTIRQGIQCRADVSPITYTWGQSQRLPLANFTSPHECKSFDSLLSWAKVNSFDPMVPGLVIHPKFGPVYDGQTDLGSRVASVDDKPVKNNGVFKNQKPTQSEHSETHHHYGRGDS